MWCSLLVSAGIAAYFINFLIIIYDGSLLILLTCASHWLQVAITPNVQVSSMLSCAVSGGDYRIVYSAITLESVAARMQS
jgi:hypothetical protein